MGIDLIKQYEGLSLKPYKALKTETYLTIGYGHYGADVTPTMKLTKVEAENLLKKDLVKYESFVNDFVKVAINQNQFDALVSFTYNCGGNALKTSTLLDKLNKSDFKGASSEFMKWNKSGGNVIDGLTKRRALECALFLKPVSVPVTPTKNYRVNYGDTLSEIAVKNKTTIKELMKVNPSIKDPRVINANQVIKIPIK